MSTLHPLNVHPLGHIVSVVGEMFDYDRMKPAITS